MNDPSLNNALQLELDRCVKCGMCLPECPTYRLETNENASPRGRLALIEGLISGRLKGDEALARHLDLCLTCRRCERVCPSQVEYGRLIDAARARLPRSARSKLIVITQHAGLQRIATLIARALPTSLSRPITALHWAHRLARALPSGTPAPRRGNYPPSGKARGKVGLFLGCLGATQQSAVATAALQLLRRAGYAVSIPKDAVCCGALGLHAGDTEGARRRADSNRIAFDQGLDAVVSIASGCGVQLDAYAPTLPAPHADICRFILDHAGFHRTDFKPLSASVALHTPCSVENVYRGTAWAEQALGLIRGLKVERIAELGQCCGAAGDYMLRHSHIAKRLRQPIVDQALSGGYQVLATSNIGCAMHLAEGLGARESAVEVVHPIELLARQLRCVPQD